MSKVILVLHTDDLVGAELFIDRKYIGITSKRTITLRKAVEEIDNNIIIEEVNIDTYLTEKERNLFLFKTENFYITEEEQDSILEGNIDYAFDIIKGRLK
jgi:hypothetical protein